MLKKLPLTVAAIVCFAVIIDGCGGGGGGGGGVVNTQIGGAIGSPCTPQYHNEGCWTEGNKRSRVKCTADATDPTKGTWQLIADCVEGKEYCDHSQKDPADPSGAKLISTCKILGQTSSGGMTSSGASSSSGGSSGGASSGASSGAASSSGASSGGGTSSGGTAPSPSDILACAQQKCGSALTACNADTSCAQMLKCAVACPLADSKCTDSCVKGGTDASLNLLASLQSCAAQKGCIPACGDGSCNLGETAQTCPSDCKSSAPTCGNGKCEDGETSQNCPKDCKSTGPVCGDGTCEDGETSQNCPKDCKSTGPICGDGTCEDGENCPADCDPSALPASCGNLQCDTAEDTNNCALDCKEDVAKQMSCASKSCSSNWQTCQKTPKCLKVMNCAAACGSDSTCGSKCLALGDSKAKDAAIALASCAASKCQDNGGCTSDAQCGSGKKCTDGKCVDAGPQCQSDADCTKAGEKCFQGKCAKPTTKPGTCKDSDCKYKDGLSCQCDSQCTDFNDCCADKAQWCPKQP